jgi:hypothetical protein
MRCLSAAVIVSAIISFGGCGKGSGPAGTGGGNGSPSSGGVVGTGGALSTGGLAGALDAQAGGAIADGPGEAATGSSKNILDLVPLDHTVSGWTVDPDHHPGERAATGNTQAELEAVIDGWSDEFFKAPYTPKVFAWQAYVNSTLPTAPQGANLSLLIVQMASEAQATEFYDTVNWGKDFATIVPFKWQEPTTPPVGAASRICDTGEQWWINFHQDVFYVEVSLAPSYWPAPDFVPGNTETKDEAIRFALAVASQI